MSRERECSCVAEHVPSAESLDQHHIWPLGWMGPDVEANLVTLCPSTHRNVHELLRAWRKFDGEPPWEIRRHFGMSARDLAERGWWAWLAAGQP